MKLANVTVKVDDNFLCTTLVLVEAVNMAVVTGCLRDLTVGS